MIILLPYRKFVIRKGIFGLLVPSLTHTMEGNIIHDCHHKYSAPHASPGGGPDAGRPRHAKALWLVRRPWSRQIEEGVRAAGLQTGLAVGQPGHPGRGGRWALRRTW